MIELFPAGREAPIDPLAAVADEARPAPAGRPWVLTNMIASADGGTAVDGLSGQLGGPADKTMFSALRAVADVIVVGASTARQERYRAPIQSDEIAAQRSARGRAPHPRLAVVSRSLDLDRELELFATPENRPYILTTRTAPADRVRELEPVAEVIRAGEDQVDFDAALGALAERGAAIALCEGGPSINGQLIATDLVDEWNLSISPRLLGADSRRAAVGPMPAGPPVGMALRRVWTDDHFLFCRWSRLEA